MQIKELRSWGDFENELEEIRQFRDSRKVVFGEAASLVFRGQSNADWPLETTLERSMPKKFSMIEYYELIKDMKGRIETETGQSWKILEMPEYLDWLREHDFLWTNGLPGIEYMAYLRHYGFPSPLLDWSKDPNVAAYFAFRNANSSAKSVAIFAYLEHFGIKGYRGAESNIGFIDQDFPLQNRHKSQQSIYTVCSTEEKGEAHYSSHEEVFTGNRRHRRPQDMLWKIIIPANERGKAIKTLASKNINGYSLFKSEDSLMETLFLESLFK